MIVLISYPAGTGFREIIHRSLASLDAVQDLLTASRVRPFAKEGRHRGPGGVVGKTLLCAALVL